MDTRRQFLKKISKAVTFLGILYMPFASGMRWAWCKTQKIILPKGTKREALIQKNPADLDTRNLAITPLNDFGTMGLVDHSITLKDWHLEVKGHVDIMVLLTYQQIISLPYIQRNVLLICPGFFANHGQWRGISIKQLLAMAEVKKGATHVTIRGPKAPYEKVESVQRFPLADINSDRVFLAYKVNGEMLPEKHGFPLRVVAEGYYGYDWIKYVYSITAEKVVPPLRTK
jgi:DMSO/TMAO reductase YedYZ molybdopterin-dependent catalytic subunit